MCVDGLVLVSIQQVLLEDKDVVVSWDDVTGDSSTIVMPWPRSWADMTMNKKRRYGKMKVRIENNILRDLRLRALMSHATIQDLLAYARQKLNMRDISSKGCYYKNTTEVADLM